MNSFACSRKNFLHRSIAALPFLYAREFSLNHSPLPPNKQKVLFTPDQFPLDTDNDLIIINDSITPAVGTVAYLSGKVTNLKGSPIRNALVEIWQVDNNGVYLHSKGGSRKN